MGMARAVRRPKALLDTFTLTQRIYEDYHHKIIAMIDGREF
jgi:hypothetical protein